MARELPSEEIAIGSPHLRGIKVTVLVDGYAESVWTTIGLDERKSLGLIAVDANAGMAVNHFAVLTNR